MLRKRYVLHCYVSGDSYPVNTYVSQDIGKITAAIANVMGNPKSGVTKIELIDTDARLPLMTKAPWDLDAPRNQ